MHIHLDDQYRHAETIVHALDPRSKVIILVSFIITVSLTPPGAMGGYLLLWLLAGLSAKVASIPITFLLKRSLIALPFVLAALTLPFTMPGDTLAQLGPLRISQAGTIRFVAVLLKSWISVQAAIILVSVTRFPDLLWGLQALRFPSALVAIVSFMYRYLFVLSDEVLRLLRARAARSATVPGQRSGGSLLWRGKVAGRMAGSLMIRSLQRSERIYQAMAARGYRGQVRSLEHRAIGRSELMLLAGLLILFFGYVAVTNGLV